MTNLTTKQTDKTELWLQADCGCAIYHYIKNANLNDKGGYKIVVHPMCKSHKNTNQEEI